MSPAATGRHAPVSVPDGVQVGANVGEVCGGGPPAEHLYEMVGHSLACGCGAGADAE